VLNLETLINQGSPASLTSPAVRSDNVQKKNFLAKAWDSK
jgi:hypothetical protein